MKKILLSTIIAYYLRVLKYCLHMLNLENQMFLALETRVGNSETARCYQNDRLVNNSFADV